MQRLSATQGVRKKKSIALPRCVCGPLSMTTILESDALHTSQNCNTKRECVRREFQCMLYDSHLARDALCVCVASLRMRCEESR